MPLLPLILFPVIVQYIKGRIEAHMNHKKPGAAPKAKPPVKTGNADCYIAPGKCPPARVQSLNPVAFSCISHFRPRNV
jgi:hypothetical protein